MRIGKFYIKNFKAIAPEKVTFDLSENIIILVGENNVGKSSILQALDLFFSGQKTVPQEQFCNFRTGLEDAISIKVEFIDLSKKDKEHFAVKPYISNENGIEKWILQKDYYYSTDGKAKCDYVAFVNGGEKKNPSGLTQKCDDLFTNEKMQKIFIPAVQDISEIIDGKKKSPFSQIFQLLLSQELKNTDEYVKLIKALENYSKIFSKDAKHEKVSEIEGLISEKIKRVINASGLIDVDLPSEEKLLPVPTLKTNDGREIPVAPINQGQGLQRCIIFAILELYAESISSSDKEVGVTNLLLIEEPEIYMHPQMEKKIADVLYNLVSSGKVQVVCSTHSPIFIRIIEKANTLVRVLRDESNKFKIIQTVGEIFNQTKDEKEQRKRLRMITKFDPSTNELFFARRVVLLEGDTEFAIFPLAADLLKVFDKKENKHKKRDTTIINCRSRDSIPSFQRVLNYFSIPYVVVHDLEKEKKDEGPNKRILDLLNNNENQRKCCDPNIEKVIDIDNESKDWFKAVKKVEDLNQSGKLEEKLGEYVKFIYNLE